MKQPVALVFLCFGLLFPLGVFAQGAETIVRVQMHFEQGAEAFQAGNYELAIKEFEAGNGLLPNPIFLYNISLAHGKLGRIEQSLAVARLAEATGLDEPDATQNRARIAGLNTASAALDMSRAAPRVKDKVPVEEPKPLLSTIGWLGVGSASLGVVSLIAAVIVDAGIGASIDNYKEAAAANDQTNYRRLKSEIESDQVVAKSLFFMGIGLGLVGAGLITYDLYFDGESGHVSLTASPDGLGTTFQWRW